MAEAHALGVVHRDLKPHNLFLTHRADGSPLVKVLDFGIAKAGALTSGGGEPLQSLTLSTSILGSPQYMAPEQVRGAKNVDHRVDVWALGVIWYELVAGVPPFSGNGPSAVLAAIAADPPARLRAIRPGISAAIEAAIERCLEKDPARRTPDVGVLAAALAPFAPPRSKVALERIAGIVAQSPFHPPPPESPEPMPPPMDGPEAAALTVTVGGAAAGSRRGLRYAAAIAAFGGAALLALAQWRPPPVPPPLPAGPTASFAAAPAPGAGSQGDPARAGPPPGPTTSSGGFAPLLERAAESDATAAEADHRPGARERACDATRTWRWRISTIVAVARTSTRSCSSVYGTE
jgi:serine/threonine-protein kinase